MEVPLLGTHSSTTEIVPKSQSHHPEWHWPAIEQKPTIIGLIIYKHSIHIKLCHSVCDKTKKTLNPCDNTTKSWTHFPLLSNDLHQKQKDKMWCSYLVQLQQEQKEEPFPWEHKATMFAW